MIKERQFDNFDEYAENYNEICDSVIGSSGASRDYYSEYKVLEVLKFEDNRKAIKILDFGCGDGNSAVYIRKHFPNSSITGVDVSIKSIQLAKEKGITNTNFNSFEGTTLPFEAEEFDVIFTSMVFHHIEHKLHAEILKEINRVLKKAGRFYNFEHNPNNFFTRKMVKGCVLDKDAMLLKPSYNRHVTSVNGFETQNLNYILFFPRHKIFKIFIGLEKILTWCPLGAQYYIRAIK
jgi:ubiquinone/menaquinone biosynthesis C-methylase UbiE